MRYMIGVDVGGTFTDVTLVNAEAETVAVHKVRSTPADPSVAIMTGITEMLAMHGLPTTQIDYLAHGTTVATNALIERKGVRTGLLVTDGFRDLLEIARQVRPGLYDLHRPKPDPLVPGHLRLEVEERLYHDGSVRRPINRDGLAASVARLKEAGVQAVAICFLFSYVNPEHEQAAEAEVRRLFPEAYVSVSHRVVPEFREYSRLSTTILNAYLGPVMQRYLENFQEAVRSAGIRVDPYITQSNGGIISIPETVANPIRTAVSGPSAGVVAATYLGDLLGLRNLITFDMGGTSADISLIENGRPRLSMDREVEGLPARIPMLDIITIGAGGGSIAWGDAGGALKVGPHSAGASPGPACYGFGGTRPTVTDANVLLGRMNPTAILGGRMALDLEAAHTACEEHVASPTGLSAVEAATGIVAVVNANMVRAIRVVSVERGYDPREFTLVAFGGAGPVHACELAEELGIPQVLIPPSPGTLCSLGLLVTDIRSDFVRTRTVPPGPDQAAQVVALFTEMAAEGTALLDQEQVPAGRRRFERRIDARYKGQNYELSIAVAEEELTADGLGTVAERFHREHERSYGYADRRRPVEFVNYRLTAVGELPKAPVRRYEPGRVEPLCPSSHREVYFAGGYRPTPVYQRGDLRPGDRFTGPAIVEQMDCTTVILPGQSVTVDSYLNLLVRTSGEGDA